MVHLVALFSEFFFVILNKIYQSFSHLNNILIKPSKTISIEHFIFIFKIVVKVIKKSLVFLNIQI